MAHPGDRNAFLVVLSYDYLGKPLFNRAETFEGTSHPGGKNCGEAIGSAHRGQHDQLLVRARAASLNIINNRFVWDAEERATCGEPISAVIPDTMRVGRPTSHLPRDVSTRVKRVRVIFILPSGRLRLNSVNEVVGGYRRDVQACRDSNLHRSC